jgi:hypothetical protein
VHYMTRDLQLIHSVRILKVMKSKRKQWIEHVARMGETVESMRNFGGEIYPKSYHSEDTATE